MERYDGDILAVVFVWFVGRKDVWGDFGLGFFLASESAIGMLG